MVLRVYVHANLNKCATLILEWRKLLSGMSKREEFVLIRRARQRYMFWLVHCCTHITPSDLHVIIYVDGAVRKTIAIGIDFCHVAL
jgi:hypothetical protein